MTAIGLALFFAGAFTAVCNAGPYGPPIDSRIEMLSAIMIGTGALLTLAGVCVFLWKHMP